MLRVNDSKAGVYIPFMATGIWLAKTLRSASTLASSDGIDSFLRTLKVWSQDEEEREFTRARLMLRHPTKPSGALMVEFYKRSLDATSSGPFLRTLLEATEGSELTMLFAQTVRAAQVLMQEGRESDARYILDTGRNLRPDVFEESATFKLSSQFEPRGSLLIDVIASATGRKLADPTRERVPVHSEIYYARRALNAGGRFTPGPRFRKFIDPKT